MHRELDGDLLYLLSFRRAGRRHAFAVVARDEENGPAEAIAPLPAEVLPEASPTSSANSCPATNSTPSPSPDLEPAEARRLLETAVRTRALQDARLDLDARFAQWDEAATPSVLGAPPYPTMIAALRNRLDVLPHPLSPGRTPRPLGGRGPGRLRIRRRPRLPEFPAAFGAAVFVTDRPRRAAPPPNPGLSRITPPTRRLPMDGPAPVYRLRIDLKGAKPPIWRRIEIPGDLTLAALHDVIQTVFEWEGYHLHVFETAYGDFGDGDVDLGHGLDDEVTIEQVLTGPGAKLTYVYDYGDYWEHVVRVERTYQGDPESLPALHRRTPRRAPGGLRRPVGVPGNPARTRRRGADVFDRDELNRRLNDGRWHGGHWDSNWPS